MNKSFGLLEVKGLAAAYYALDKMLKSTEIKYVTNEKELGAGLSTIIIEGNISAVKIALEEGRKEASMISDVLTAAAINNPHPEIASFIYQKNKRKKKIISRNMAIGFIEIFGYAASLVAADQALKSSNITLLGLDKTKGKPHTPGLIMFLKLAGSTADVKTAVAIALRTSEKLTGSTAHSIISRSEEMLNKLIKEGI
ncbi:MAG: BMC domain-containing protein [Firmicutes bacterium]|nr:BMC domain-containing protein [Bacillota bacterium]